MGRKIKFALEMQDGSKIRSNIEELRKHFDLSSVMGYFASGKLQEWLEDRYYEDEAEQIAALDKDAKNVDQEVCRILGVKYQDKNSVDIEYMQRLNEKKSILRQVTDDENILDHVEQVAFNQEELADLLDEDTKLIYLYGDSFQIPLRKKNKTYIGINEPNIIIRAESYRDLKENDIKFQNVHLPNVLTKPQKQEETAVQTDSPEFMIMAFLERIKGKYGENEAKAEKAFLENHFDEAGDLFLEESKKDNLRACYFLVEYYVNAYGKFPFNHDMEMKLRKICLNSHDPLVKMQGIYSLSPDTGEFQNAFKRIKSDLLKESYQGDPFACSEICSLFYNNRHYDIAEAAITEDEYNTCFAIAKKMGYGYAINRRGDHFRKVKKDNTEAFKWYREASSLGYPASQYELAFLYLYGLGVEKDDKKAFSLLKSSAERGFPKAMGALGNWYNDGSLEKLNYRKGAEWFKKGAEKNEPYCQKFLGDCYFGGFGVEEDEEKAFLWYMKSAEQGNPGGQYGVGICYYNGAGVEENVNEAFLWFMRAARQGNAEGQCGVGEAYLMGEAVENFVGGIRDDKKAFEWFKKAADQGNPTAMHHLGDMYYDKYYNGGTSSDLAYAKWWYSKAADRGDEEAKTKAQQVRRIIHGA